ncbi:MAG: pyocin knob domain-containing protein, partial [Psychrobacillus psychrotolerans]|uniref:pyocin knob domain-containing protein n=1 Tax=Psychrobacillus psychrotolerans TaxID=126156 RepID=UPI003BAF3472
MAEQLPIWQDPGVEPPALLKTNGWQPGMKPSAQHMNWLFNRIYKCLEAIQAGGGTEELEQELKDLQLAFATHITAKATVNEVGHVQLSNLINGTSETKAATELAIKTLNDIVATKQKGITPLADGTNLNAVKETGDYFGYNFINGAESTISTFEVLRYSVDWIVQFQHVITNGVPRTYKRAWYSGTTWSPWVRELDMSMVNVPYGVIGLDANGNAPGNLTGKGVKLGEVNFAVTPGLIVEFVIPPGYKKVIMEGEVDFDTLTQGQLYMQFNDLAAN